MKSSELLTIFKDGSIVIPIFFMKQFKNLKLEMSEFVFLMYLYHLGNSTFDPSKYAGELNMEIGDIMNYISVLTEKGFIEVKVQKNDKNVMEEFVVLDGFFQKLSLLMMDVSNKIGEANASNVYEMIESEFGRTLSPIEYEIIKAWLDTHISEELIREAVKEATFNGVSNLRYIDKILYEWGRAGIKNVADVEDMRKKRNQKIKKDQSEEIDTDIFDWNWFDEEDSE